MTKKIVTALILLVIFSTYKPQKLFLSSKFKIEQIKIENNSIFNKSDIMKKKLISIVTPCYNEEGNVASLYEQVKFVIEGLLNKYDYEHIFIDNASSDNTLEIVRSYKDPRISVISNEKNTNLLEKIVVFSCVSARNFALLLSVVDW